MNANEFTIMIKEHSRDFAVEWSEGDNVGVSSKTQEWLNGLSSSEKVMLREVLQETVDNSIFSLFEIMDGVHSKNSTPIKAVCGTDRISGENCPQLHELYASKI